MVVKLAIEIVVGMVIMMMFKMVDTDKNYFVAACT